MGTRGGRVTERAVGSTEWVWGYGTTERVRGHWRVRGRYWALSMRSGDMGGHRVGHGSHWGHTETLEQYGTSLAVPQCLSQQRHFHSQDLDQKCPFASEGLLP